MYPMAEFLRVKRFGWFGQVKGEINVATKDEMTIPGEGGYGQ